ncbi:MAG: glutamate-1-semialdehyde 2,1-aminomutase [Coriobacteriia bacterium]|nr:glutamate-1-semialdehyde 2,1-aminomutase [Coriobacteriia bacterium]
MPGGVNSPVRATKAATGRDPLFIASGRGAHITTIDGATYLDYVASWGPLILGHAHPAVIAAVQQAATQGLSFGAPTTLETQLAAQIAAAYPSMQQVRLVNSGTEATMSALRLARAATGRNLIIKFAGNYHGHSDALLAQAGSGALTHGVPTSAGVPPQTAATTLVASYNNAHEVAELFNKYNEEIAAVIVEPVAGNMGVVPPLQGFLPALRELTSAHGSLLIFDEVMTGFRVAFGGAQQRFGIDPDITCLGKIVGGGLPLAAYGGKAQLMQLVSPVGPMYQAGTLAGNPLATTAGLATIEQLKRPGFYEGLEAQAATLAQGIRAAAERQGIPLQVNSVGAMLSVFFTSAPVTNLTTATTTNAERFTRFYQAMLDAGIYLPPSPFEAWFPSAAHTPEDIATTLHAVEHALSTLS